MKYTWFLSVNYNGNWLTQHGQGTVTINDDSTILADLSDDSGTRIKITGQINEEGVILDALVVHHSKYFDEDEHWIFHGIRDFSDVHDKTHETFIFTDARRVIGIAGVESNL